MQDIKASFLGGSELKKMKLIDDMATCQDVYCGGSFAPKQGTSFRNTIAIAPLKSFLKVTYNLHTGGIISLFFDYFVEQIFRVIFRK